MNSNFKNKNIFASGYTNIISNIVGVYVFLMLAGFPLFLTDKYYNVLFDKFYYFWVLTAIMSVLSSLVMIIGFYRECKAKSVGVFKELGDNIRGLGGRLILPDYLFVFFMFVITISTMCSEWSYEAFWGNMGRYQGLFLWIWFALAYIFISRFFRFEKKYINIYLFAGVLVALFAISDYLVMDIFGWQHHMRENIREIIFSSTIGNINVLTAVLGMYLAVAASMFISEDSRVWSCIYAIITFIMLTAMITGQSDNAVLGLGAVICFLPFYAWKTRRGFIRYIAVVAMLLLAFVLVGMLTACYRDRIVSAYSGVLLKLANTQQSIITMLLAVVMLLFIAVYILMYASARKKNQSFGEYLNCKMSFIWRAVWAVMGICAFIGLVYLFYDANTCGQPDKYGPLAEILVFNEHWGTGRGSIWQMLIGYFKDFNLFKMLFGSGLETFGIYTRVHDYYHMLEMSDAIVDSPHSEVLQYLFCTGILGVIGYYGGIAVSCIKMFTAKLSRYAYVFAFALITYTVQSVINISTPGITPMVIMLLALGINCIVRGDRQG